MIEELKHEYMMDDSFLKFNLFFVLVFGIMSTCVYLQENIRVSIHLLYKFECFDERCDSSNCFISFLEMVVLSCLTTITFF